MKRNVIFDLDGTLADCEHRRHHVEGDIKNWDAFFDECDRDNVIEHVVELLKFYKATGYDIYILSGRMGNDDTADKTVRWLTKNNILPHLLPNYVKDDRVKFYMRQKGDYRPDVEVKREMIDRLGLTPDNTVATFDDRNCMVEAWREWGFNCFQVAEGDF